MSDENVEMQVRYGLAGVFSGVGDHTEASFGETFLAGDLGDRGKYMTDQSGIGIIDLGTGSYVCFGDHKDMSGRLGIDISESVAQVILVDFV